MKAELKHIYVLSGMLGKFFFSTLYGTLFTSIILYGFTLWFTNLGTFKVWELVLWLDSQSDETKGLLLSSALTITGFLVAFQGATKNWRDQVHANLRLQAASDIQETYNKTCLLISSLDIYAGNLIEITQRIENNEPPLKISLSIQYALSLNEKFLSERAELSKLHIGAFNLNSKYSMVIFLVNRGMEQLAQINAAVGKVAEAMSISIPDQTILEDADHIRLFYSRVDQKRWKELIETCKSAHTFVSANSGHLCGHITAPTTEFSMGTFVNFLRHGRMLFKAQDDLLKGKAVNLDALGGG